ncbi:MAG TPA: tetratricopeptide repeat protein [Patescibacteria group bacterium]|nr:tetratricopeptide repeat protein [Patescibacteria group bacterium]
MHTARLNRWAVALLTVLLFAVPLLHSPRIADPFDLPKETAIIVAALLVGLLAIAGAGARRVAGPLPRSIALSGLGLMLAGVAATLVSANRAFALWDLVRTAALLVLAWGVVRFVREARHAAWPMRAAIAAATLVAAGTLAQVAIPGYGVSIAGVSLLPAVPAGATLGDPGLAIQFLLLAAPLGLGAAALSGSSGRLLTAAALGVVITAVIYAGRPEGWMAAALITAALIATRVARAFATGEGWRDLTPDLGGGALRAALVTGAVVLLIVAVSRMPGLSSGTEPMAPLPHVGLLAPTTGDPTADRHAAIQGTTSLLAIHPLGVGPGYWRHGFLEVAWKGAAASPFTLSHQAVHVGNSLLELTSEYGVAGGALFLALLLLVVLGAARTALRDPGPAGTVALAALDVMLATVVVSFFGSPFQDATPALLFWIAAGLAAASAGLGAPATSPGAGTPAETGRTPAPLRWSLAAVWAIVAVSAGVWIGARFVRESRTLEGQSLLFAGDSKGAIAVLSEPAVLRAPDHLPHVLLGNACLRAGRYQDAAAAFGATLARSPWYLSAFLGRAAAYQELGLYDRADDDLQAALAIAPGNSDLVMSLGRLDTRRGRLEQAIADYRRAAELTPTLADAWYNIGEIYARQGQYDAALEAFRTCSSKNPRHPRVNLGLGDAYEHKGIYEMALEYYQRAASLDERSVEPRLRLANMFHATGKDCEAKESLMAARDLETDPGRRASILTLIDTVDAGCRRFLKAQQG